MRLRLHAFIWAALVPVVAQTPSVNLTLTASGVGAVTDIQHAGDGSGRLFFVRQNGIIRLFKNGVLAPTPFLDIQTKTTGMGERGLLGLAFPPGFATKHYFYVNYTNLAGHTVIARYYMTANPDIADSTSEQILLTVNQPFVNHNGGQLRFSPHDGYLYIGMGDGGGGGDPLYNAQTPLTALGKMLRVDVESDLSQMRVPPSNPFVGNLGYLPSIWALGFRNPWRFSFDRLTGDLWIADVGQERAEEVSFQPGASLGGENYGWNHVEGFQCYIPNCITGGMVWPVVEYSHVEGCSVIGGSVYRGNVSPSFQGMYLYADLCSGRIWGLWRSGAGWSNRLLADVDKAISTFGEDEVGEIYLAEYQTGEIFRVTFSGAWPASVAPTAVSVAPSSGSGSTQTFSAGFSDSDGYTELAWVQLLVAAAPDGGGQAFCMVHYDRASNQLWLWGDAGYFLGGVRPGIPSVLLQNSACALDTGGATFSVSGNALTLNLPVTFKSALVGNRNLYLRGYDFAGNDTGFQQRGTWAVTAAPIPPMTLSPASGSGSVQMFTGIFPAPVGFGPIPAGWVQMMFAAAPDGGGQPYCLIHYDRTGNGMWLLGDAGFFLGPVAPGAPSSLLENSVCRVNTAAATVSNNGSLTWNLPMTFKAPLSGVRNAYLRMFDALGRDSGFQLAGSWTVTQPPHPPVTHSALPSSGSGLSQTFAALFSDGDGFANLAYIEILVANNISASDGGHCYAFYDRAGNGLWLYGNAGFFLGPGTPGVPSSMLENASCRVNTAASSVSVAGSSLTMNLALIFKQPAFSGARKVFLRAGDLSGQHSGWQERGSWTVP